MPPVSIAVHRLVRELSATVWLDTGVRGPFEVLHLERFRNVRPIVASETLGIGPLIRAIPEELFRLRPAVSIDLRDGNLVTDEANPSTPTDFATKMYRFGFRTFILLDLARVGMNAGPGTESLCDELRRLYPDIELLVGGGVRNRDDIKRLEDAGADGVLVASALHDGTLP